MRRRIVRIAVVVVALAAAFLGPHVAWWLERRRTLEVVIVDKTVPFKNEREHAAIPWVLHALKIGDALGHYLDPARDYVGFDPVSKQGRPLTPQDLAGADVLFVADTYGVYQGDYARGNDEAALERSPKIYGGLDVAEADAIGAFARAGGMVLAEFNTFGSPTEDAARARLESTFGVRWTKWVGRYWPNLQDANEVPRWVGRIYERTRGHPFDLTGGGFVLVHEDSDIVVLRDGTDLNAGVIRQERTPLGAAYGFPETGFFRYWLDVVDAADSEVLYEHVVDVTAAGARALAAHGLRPRFPAVTRRRDAWYFAGDFVDNTLDLGSPERAAIMTFRNVRLACGTATAEEEFFWGWYAPIMSRLLSSRAR